MNIFFDVDYTLVTWDGRLRPGVHEIFQRLCEDGHLIYLWSGVGPRWETELVTGCFSKPLYDFHHRIVELGVTITPDYVVDDYESIVQAFPGTQIAGPPVRLNADREMWRVYDEIQGYVAARAADAQNRPPD